MTTPALSTDETTLECSHCGGDAIESEDGTFGDGDGDACITCGFPGSVRVTQEYDADGDEVNCAYWSCRDGNDDVCDDRSCEECRETRQAFGLPFEVAHRISTEGTGEQ